MCGICGNFILSGAGNIDIDVLKRMVLMLRHRGPDQRGVYRDEQAGLAHARLSIIDLKDGQQPIHNEDGTVWITYNGEIFNYPELRAALVEKGHRFSTKTDTEVIVHLYEEKGLGMFEHLNGQFAFALWDRRDRTFLLARDRLGIRPLFYTVAGGSLLFGSEVKAILADPRVRAEMDVVGLEQFFTFWSTVPPRTVFKDIRELPPAHYLVVREGTIAVKRYWDIPLLTGRGPEATTGDEEAYAGQLLELLKDAVRIRLRADVPVAAYLSGGLDSSFITALVKKHFNNELRTFSVAFADKDYDESVFQKQMADFLGTDHTGITCAYADIGKIIPEVVWHAEKPLVRTAPAPLYLLSDAVRNNGFKVVLTGEGSDEVLGGYDLFKEMKIRRFWARIPDSRFRSLLLKKLYSYVPHWPRRAPAYLEAFYRPHLLPTGLPAYSHLPRWRTTAGTKQFFSGDVKAALAGYDSIAGLTETLPAGFAETDHLSMAQYLEIVTLLSGNLLSSQGDRMMMAHGVEGRLPFLDYRVVEFGMRLPARLKLNVLNEKYLLKKAASPYLPASITRRTKQAYRAPDGISFFNGKAPEYVGDLLAESTLARTNYFSPAAVQNLVRKCAASPQLVGTRDNIAIVGIISTLLLDHLFISNFKRQAPEGSEDIRVFGLPDGDSRKTA